MSISKLVGPAVRVVLVACLPALMGSGSCNSKPQPPAAPKCASGELAPRGDTRLCCWDGVAAPSGDLKQCRHNLACYRLFEIGVERFASCLSPDKQTIDKACASNIYDLMDATLKLASNPSPNAVPLWEGILSCVAMKCPEAVIVATPDGDVPFRFALALTDCTKNALNGWCAEEVNQCAADK